MKKKNKYLIFSILFSFILTGCWDYRDVNKRSITLSIGVDESKGNIKFNAEAATNIPHGGSEISKVSNNINVDEAIGRQFEDARIDYLRRKPFPDFSGAVRVVIFSKNFAEKGITPYINRINLLYGYRKSLLIVVCRESTKALLSQKIKDDISVGYSIENTIESLSSTGLAIQVSEKDILAYIALKNVGYLIPYVTNENNSIVLLGYAVMKDSKLIDTLDLLNSNGVLYLLSKKPFISGAIPSPSNDRNTISYVNTLNKRKISTSYINNKIVINIDLALKTQIVYEYRIEPLSNDDRKKIEKQVSDIAKNYIETLIKKSQQEYQSDILQLYRYFRADNIEASKTIDWKTAYPNAAINVNVTTKITNTNFLDPNASKKY